MNHVYTLDTDGDRFISLDELIAAGGTDEDIQDFHDIDTNNDNLLSEDELTAYYYLIFGEEEPTSPISQEDLD